MMKRLKIIPLEERILLDAAIAAVIAQPLITPDASHGSVSADSAVSHPPVADLSVQNNQTAQTVIYVNVNAKGSIHDGKSWNTAYSNLQDALNKATATPGIDQIWIAQGTYLPSKIYSPDGVVGGASGLNDAHLKTFDIPTGTTLYGGFKAGMTSLAQANPDKYVTILSGDLLGNDINNPSNANYAATKADNAWHVVTMGNDISQSGVTASLNGLSIFDGYANGPGGAAFSPFTFNHNFGGGAYIAFDSVVSMNDTLFQNNFAASDGGGIFTNNVDFTVSNSTFLNNTALVRGGGIVSYNTFEAEAHVSNVINSYFQGNTSNVFGGAIVGEGTFPHLNSEMNVINSTFVNNLAPEGGAITVDSLTFNVDKSTFIGNHATVTGGAIATTNIVDSIVGGPNEFVTTVSNSTFLNNVADGDLAAHEALNNFLGFPIGVDFARGGGALTTYINGYLDVRDSLFIGNVAKSGDGGAILNGHATGDNVFGSGLTSGEATTTVSGSIFIGNRALDGNGGAIASASNHLLPDNPADLSLTVKNSTFLTNKASDNGGALYADTSLMIDRGNTLLGNQADLGDQLYATNAVLNNIPSSNPAAYLNQVLVNKFKLLDNDDLYLI